MVISQKLAKNKAGKTNGRGLATGGPGGSGDLWNLGVQLTHGRPWLTLFQSGGQITPTPLLLAPPDLKTYLHLYNRDPVIWNTLKSIFFKSFTLL